MLTNGEVIMGLRANFIALALVFSAAATAHAQSPASETSTPATAAIAPPTDAALAGAEVMEALVYDSGLLETTVQTLLQQMMPQLRQQLLQSSLYNSVSARAQSSLLAYLETMPDFLRQSLRTEFNVIAERVGVRLAERLTADELNGIADFMRHPSSRSFFNRLAVGYVNDNDTEVEPTPQEIAAVEQFMLTPAGRAFEREVEYINTVVREEFQAGSTRMEPQIQAQIAAGICDALGRECPRQLRQSTGRT